MGYRPASGEDEQLLQRRVSDMVKAAAHTGRAGYTGFLNDREVELATAALRREKWEQYRFFGGYEGAERCMLCVFEDTRMVRFPLVALTIAAKGAVEPGHRDYLGAILGLGLERGCIGDIVVSAGEGAVVFVQERIAPLILEELTSVGRAPVSVHEGGQAPGSPQESRTVAQVNVASLRLDAVLAAALNLSRTAAAGAVAGGDVQVNHVQVQKPHQMLEEGDVLSIRGKGKFRLEAVKGKSRKNRTFIQVLKY